MPEHVHKSRQNKKQNTLSFSTESGRNNKPTLKLKENHLQSFIHNKL